MMKLTGLIAATFTPMTDQAQINLKPVETIVDRLISRGITGLYVCGSTGEGPSLTAEERKAVARAYVEAAGGRIPVIVQVGHNSIEEARALAAHAAEIGADAISAVSPSYYLPESTAVLVETLGHITDAAPELPFYYYHIPKLSGLSVNMMEFLKQAPSRVPTLAGIKFSAREIEVMQQCLAFGGGRYNILFGVDETLLSGLVAGAHGAVGSTYNFLSPLYQKVMRHLSEGDLEAAQRCQLQAAGIIEVILRYHGLAGLKAAMSLSGIPCGPVRLPLTPLRPDEHSALEKELQVLGFPKGIG
ncbi:MAG TPA: dihydrodipicolinate synthase family protein [Candidatus Hydrogenedentes bacterium]|jgi:N-acetylneuraminate lyase|nr:dihydrodipicolinate synthase family protein [Candidatus Hydrogenedentota bacterium]HOM47378.1 dihydrodipicolinate synthase family protein [Candidatus Hydrogenedentota bacterium]HPK25518.1 dihydrodipicolinate synthase family protein [Candidatus Hydrogenedentota bacterium]HPX87065.1 dihydrodipicolinate synthase family protein [Candidatus Hydrogenedentota bacterium]